MEKKRSLEGTFLLGQALGAITGILLARAVGPVGRGEITTLALWGQLMGWGASLSLDKAVIVLTKAEHGALRRRVAFVTSRRMVAAFTVPAAGISLVLGRHFFRDWYLPVLLMLVAIMTAQSELVGGWLLALQKRSLYIAWRVAQPSVYFLVVGGVALLRLQRVIRNDEAINLVATGILVSVCVPMMLMLLKSLRGRGGWFSKDAALHLLRYGLAAQTANVLQFLNGRLDLLTLTLISTSATVGIYAVGSSASQIVLFLGSAAVVRALAEGGGQRDRLGAIASVTVAALVIITAPFAIPFVFGAVFEPAVAIAQILAIGSIVYYFLQAACGRLLGENHPWHVTAAQAAGVALFLGLLVPFHGIRGVAWDSVASYVASLAIAELLHVRNHRRPRPWTRALSPSSYQTER